LEGDYKYGRCGVFCETCPAGNGRVEELAKELKRLTSDFFKDFPKGHGGFDWAEYRNGLDYFIESYSCPTCTKIEEPWCDVLKCEKVLEKESCLLQGPSTSGAGTPSSWSAMSGSRRSGSKATSRRSGRRRGRGLC
jgi:hypothetical protein